MGIVRDGGAEQLARMLPRTPDKQAANLIANGSMVQRTAYVERVMDPKLSLPAYRRTDNGAMWMRENLMELPGTAEESSLFEEGCVAERLTLLPHQSAQASLSSVGSWVATLPAVLADLSGSLGEKVRKNRPGSELVASMWEGVRSLRDEGGVTEEMGEMVPRMEGQGIPPRASKRIREFGSRSVGNTRRRDHQLPQS